MNGGSFRQLLKVLHDADVDFVLIGGLAAMVAGSTRATFDVDVVYSRERSNLSRLSAALMPYVPYPRDAPPGLPFRWDEKTLAAGLNFTLTCQLGDIDLFGEVLGGGTYERLVIDSDQLTVFGLPIRVVKLSRLIELKRATGRLRDLEAIAELELLRRRSE